MHAETLRARLAEIELEHAKALRTLDKMLFNRHPSAMGRKKALMERLDKLEAERERIAARLDTLLEETRR